MWGMDVISNTIANADMGAWLIEAADIATHAVCFETTTNLVVCDSWNIDSDLAVSPLCKARAVELIWTCGTPNIWAAKSGASNVPDIITACVGDWLLFNIAMAVFMMAVSSAFCDGE